MNIKKMPKIDYLFLVILTISFILAVYYLFSSDNRFLSVVEMRKESPIGTLIQASYPNFGGMIIHFEKPMKKSDYFTFELLESDTNRLVYSSKYPFHDVFYLPKFPFGFPPIKDSENKTYKIKLYPMDFMLVTRGVSYELIYPFNIYQIFKGDKLIRFIKGKTDQYIDEFVYSRYLIFFLFPSFLYILVSLSRVTSFTKIFFRLLNQSKLFYTLLSLIKPSFFLLLTIISYDVLYVSKPSNGYIFMLSLFWVYLILIYKYTYTHSFLISFYFMLLSPLFMISDMSYSIDKTAIWSYVFLIIGSIQTFFTTNNFKLIINTPVITELINPGPVERIDKILSMYSIKLVKILNDAPSDKSKRNRYLLFLLYMVTGIVFVMSTIIIYRKSILLRNKMVKPTRYSVIPISDCKNLLIVKN